MKRSVMLTITSLLSVLLFSFHLADDIVRGFEPGKLINLTAVPIFVFWLYGTDVPTFFVSGVLDNNTQPFQADEMRKTFKNSTHLVIDNAGHESMPPLVAPTDFP